MPTLYTPTQQISRPLAGGGQDGSNGSLAAIYKPGSYGSYINVTKDFPWTVSEAAKQTVGRVILKEFEVNESTLKRQAAFYLSGLQQFKSGLLPQDIPEPAGDLPRILEVYRDLYPKDRPTNFVYDFPYFDDINFSVNTPQWASLDTIESLTKAAGTGLQGITNFFKGIGAEPVGNAIALGIDALGFVGQGAGAALGYMYPKVGILDRPRLWHTHEFRKITINIPLFNTLKPDDWKLNRELCELLVNQNLYNKRDVVTSIPPVFYEVLVVGQHYSWASCVTDLKITNIGNMRMLTDSSRSTSVIDTEGFEQNFAFKCNVPDVYGISIELTDLVVPSKNQFQALQDPVVFSNIIDPNKVINQLEPPLPDLRSADVAPFIPDPPRANQPSAPGTGPNNPTPAPGGSGQCWVAREIYGIQNIKWIIFRNWLYGNGGPKWLQTLYTKFGEQFAKWISNKPLVKKIIKLVMDQIIRNYETK